jgi:hypothetical protein
VSTPCKTCGHEQRAAIDLGLAHRVPIRVLARKFGLTQQSIFRHKRRHLSPQMKAALQRAVRPTKVDLEQLRHTESENLIQHVVAQRARLYVLGDKAEAVGDLRAAAMVHGRLTSNLELSAKLLGELRTASVTVTQNILVTPQYNEARAALIRALRPFPEARKAVVQVLHSVESKAAEVMHEAPREEA